MRKKIVYISGTRADFGLMEKSLQKINKKAQLIIIATCMHLDKKFGYTVREIEKSKFRIKKIKTLVANNSLESMLKSFSSGILKISKAIVEIKPDLILLEGDRGEALAGAIAGAHLNIQVVHHGGGDTSGSIDNKIRYAITSFSDYHLTGNKKSYKRLISMGILESRVFDVGEPGLDDILEKKYTKRKAILKKININSKKPLILLIFHPNTEQYVLIEKQIKEIILAIKALEIPTIALYANADAGGEIINDHLREAQTGLSFLKLYKHFPRKDFLGLMNACSIMIGNSSAGLIEFPYFEKPFVNIGNRQNKRLKPANVVQVKCKKKDIQKAIKKALFDKKIKRRLKGIKNPYEKINSSGKIATIILNLLKK